MKKAYIRIYVFSVFVLSFFNCENNSLEIEPMAVKVRCYVTHNSPISGEYMATEDAIVDILNTSGRPVKPDISLTSTTDSLGMATIITNNEILLPRNNYIAAVSYPSSTTAEKEFQIPQYPNNVKEYVIDLEIQHSVGDDPNYVPKVKVQVYIQEKIPGTDSLRNSASADLGLYDLDGINTPAPDNYVYKKTTNNDGYAEFIVSRDYFLPGGSYAVKASKNAYNDNLVSFTVPTELQGSYYIVIVNIILDFN
ncbi:hypothetical protein ACFL4T_00565 [candidate division KSB1 bacterium]